ncbi:MAG: hypothetical protein R3E97_23750 [Candidatus Eisenbacteria bacterium]
MSRRITAFALVVTALLNCTGCTAIGVWGGHRADTPFTNVPVEEVLAPEAQGKWFRAATTSGTRIRGIVEAVQEDSTSGQTWLIYSASPDTSYTPFARDTLDVASIETTQMRRRDRGSYWTLFGFIVGASLDGAAYYLVTSGIGGIGGSLN